MTISYCHCYSGPFSVLIALLALAHNFFGLGLRARLMAQCSALPPRATVLCCGFFWKMEGERDSVLPPSTHILRGPTCWQQGSRCRSSHRPSRDHPYRCSAGPAGLVAGTVGPVRRPSCPGSWHWGWTVRRAQYVYKNRAESGLVGSGTSRIASR